jgi:hypothetical protein
MYRYELENPGTITRDEETEEERLFSSAGGEHEASILANFKISEREVVEISREDVAFAKAKTIAAIQDKVPIIFQAALEDGVFGVKQFQPGRQPKASLPVNALCALVFRR